jgi:hypothetical protein
MYSTDFLMAQAIAKPAEQTSELPECLEALSVSEFEANWGKIERRLTMSIAGVSVNDWTPCPICGAEAEHDLDCLSNETPTYCSSCGYFAETRLIVTTDGRRFWAETRHFPMDETGRVNRG